MIDNCFCDCFFLLCLFVSIYDSQFILFFYFSFLFLISFVLFGCQGLLALDDSCFRRRRTGMLARSQRLACRHWLRSVRPTRSKGCCRYWCLCRRHSFWAEAGRISLDFTIGFLIGIIEIIYLRFGSDSRLNFFGFHWRILTMGQ